MVLLPNYSGDLSFSKQTSVCVCVCVCKHHWKLDLSHVEVVTGIPITYVYHIIQTLWQRNKERAQTVCDLDGVLISRRINAKLVSFLSRILCLLCAMVPFFRSYFVITLGIFNHDRKRAKMNFQLKIGIQTCTQLFFCTIQCNKPFGRTWM